MTLFQSVLFMVMGFSCYGLGYYAHCKKCERMKQAEALRAEILDPLAMSQCNDPIIHD